MLQSIACPSDTTCYTVGADGAIQVTRTAGQTWTRQASGTQADLFAIACPSVTACYAVGSRGTLVATTDGGRTWTRRASGTQADLLGIACPGVTVCYAVANNGRILHIATAMPPKLPLRVLRTVQSGQRGEILIITIMSSAHARLTAVLQIAQPAGGTTKRQTLGHPVSAHASRATAAQVADAHGVARLRLTIPVPVRCTIRATLTVTAQWERRASTQRLPITLNAVRP
jgi:hypothetical protein